MKQQQAAHEVVCCVYCFWILSARHLLVTPFFDFSFLGGGFIPPPPPHPTHCPHFPTSSDDTTPEQIADFS